MRVLIFPCLRQHLLFPGVYFFDSSDANGIKVASHYGTAVCLIEQGKQRIERVLLLANLAID